MSDYQIFIAMLKRAGVVYCEVPTTMGHYISLPSCAGKANDGFSGLTSTFRFDHNGTLHSIGVWEEGVDLGAA